MTATTEPWEVTQARETLARANEVIYAPVSTSEDRAGLLGEVTGALEVLLGHLEGEE